MGTVRSASRFLEELRVSSWMQPTRPYSLCIDDTTTLRHCAGHVTAAVDRNAAAVCQIAMAELVHPVACIATLQQVR